MKVKVKLWPSPFSENLSGHHQLINFLSYLVASNRRESKTSSRIATREVQRRRTATLAEMEKQTYLPGDHLPILTLSRSGVVKVFRGATKCISPGSSV